MPLFATVNHFFDCNDPVVLQRLGGTDNIWMPVNGGFVQGHAHSYHRAVQWAGPGNDDFHQVIWDESKTGGEELITDPVKVQAAGATKTDDQIHMIDQWQVSDPVSDPRDDEQETTGTASTVYVKFHNGEEETCYLTEINAFGTGEVGHDGETLRFELWKDNTSIAKGCRYSAEAHGFVGPDGTVYSLRRPTST